MYAASIMFGYFVRRVDTRFQLEKGLGLLDEGSSDAVSRLERLFAQVLAPPDITLRCSLQHTCCPGCHRPPLQQVVIMLCYEGRLRKRLDYSGMNGVSKTSLMI